MFELNKNQLDCVNDYQILIFSKLVLKNYKKKIQIFMMLERLLKRKLLLIEYDWLEWMTRWVIKNISWNIRFFEFWFRRIRRFNEFTDFPNLSILRNYRFSEIIDFPKLSTFRNYRFSEIIDISNNSIHRVRRFSEFVGITSESSINRIRRFSEFINFSNSLIFRILIFCFQFHHDFKAGLTDGIEMTIYGS